MRRKTNPDAGWLTKRDLRAFKFPYLVLKDGVRVLRTFDPDEALRGAAILSAQTGVQTAFLRSGDATSLRWYSNGVRIAEPGEGVAR